MEDDVEERRWHDGELKREKRGERREEKREDEKPSQL
jgi:hypothetical protein